MVSATNPNEIEKAKVILKAALARPIEERLARLKASGIVDADGQIAVGDQVNGRDENGAKSKNGKHS